MSQRSHARLLRDMLEHAQMAVDAARDRSRMDLDNDYVLRAACERFVQIVGEAANQIIDEDKSINPEIPWRKIIGTRNLLVHGYVQIDLDILWNIIETDLPELIGILEKALGE